MGPELFILVFFPEFLAKFINFFLVIFDHLVFSSETDPCQALGPNQLTIFNEENIWTRSARVTLISIFWRFISRASKVQKNVGNFTKGN